MKLALIIALPEETKYIDFNNIYVSGVGKVNATIAAMKAIHEGADMIINYGSAGSVNDIKGLVEVTGYVDRDMDATANGFELGQTPYEDGVIIGSRGLVCGSGDTFATTKPKIECNIVDMESYAIAKVCKTHNVKFKCYKYISDHVDENSSKDWKENVSKGNKLFQGLLSIITGGE
jgi:adenosylhomocysteine nucleosidase